MFGLEDDKNSIKFGQDHFNQKYNENDSGCHKRDPISFDADFECANVDTIRKVSQEEYHIFIRGDSNGKGNT